MLRVSSWSLAPMPVTLPEQFGRYRILKKLGEGGMGTVYLAEDTKLGRRVALKVPQLDGENATVIQRFQREAKVAARLEHPNLCPLLDIGDIDGIHYLTMPFIDGTPLSKLIDEGSPWEVQQAVELVCRLARALEVMHDNGVIHRDLKPANVMIRKDGQPVLMDFGLARSLGATSQNLTRLGASLGTPGYMPPEQVTGDQKALGPASDVYSLGVLLYELLTGRRPFSGPSITELFGQVLHAVPEQPSARRPGLSAKLDAVCLKALAKKPAERYDSMRTFVAALEALSEKSTPTVAAPARAASSKTLRVTPGTGPTLAPRDGSATGPFHPTIATQAPLSSRKKRKALALAIAGGVVALALLVLWLWPRGETVRPSGKEGNGDPDAGTFQGLDREIINSVGMKLILIRPGKFRRVATQVSKGKPPGGPFEVEITRPYYLGAHEVTQGEYLRVRANTRYDPQRGQLPADSLTWTEAAAYCDALSARDEEKRAGRTYRLPTEAEWEYACRAGTATLYSFGDSISLDQANLEDVFPAPAIPLPPKKTRPVEVGSYPPNAWGLFDMHGNLYEWCQDWHDPDYYAKAPPRDPPGPERAQALNLQRVLRGGGYQGHPSYAQSGYRMSSRYDGAERFYGCRVACDVRK